MTSQQNQNWLYLKIYLGDATDKMDDVLIELGRLAEAQTSFDDWFYIRYFDESGFHIRFRVSPHEGLMDQAKQELAHMWSQISSRLTEFLPSSYVPMTELPNFSTSQLPPGKLAHKVDAVYADYEQEEDKFGSDEGINIAEKLFCESSRIACDILLLERDQQFSRKTLLPLLMTSCFDNFRIRDAENYWRQYSQFWLGGDTPAAEDRREVFFVKAEQLREGNIPILATGSSIPEEAQQLLQRWHDALKSTYISYQKIKDEVSFSYNVLCFNFSHLMMNRLGLTAIEESYMAALLEHYCAYEKAA